MPSVSLRPQRDRYPSVSLGGGHSRGETDSKVILGENVLWTSLRASGQDRHGAEQRGALQQMKMHLSRQNIVSYFPDKQVKTHIQIRNKTPQCILKISPIYCTVIHDTDESTGFGCRM